MQRWERGGGRRIYIIWRDRRPLTTGVRSGLRIDVVVDAGTMRLSTRLCHRTMADVTLRLRLRKVVVYTCYTTSEIIVPLSKFGVIPILIKIKLLRTQIAIFMHMCQVRMGITGTLNARTTSSPSWRKNKGLRRR